MRGFGRRFAAEVGFIVLVAVGLAAANLSWPAIILLMTAAWVLTALVEFVAWRRGRGAAPERPPVAQASAESAVGGLESHVRVIGVEPPPAASRPGPEPEPVAEEPEPEPEPEPVAVEPEPEPVAVEPEPVAAAPQAWNIWELDRLARDAPEERRDELAYLLMYLRDFASPQGMLSTDFDELIRESFGDLLAAGAR